MNPDALRIQARDFRNSGQIEQAVDVYKRLADHYKDAGDVIQEATCYHMIGVSYKEGVSSKDSLLFRESINAYHKAIDLFSSAGRSGDIGIVQRDEAIVYMYAGEYEAAEGIFPQSIAATDEAHMFNQSGITKDKWGLSLFAHGKYDEALAKMEEGLSDILNVGGEWFYEGTIFLDMAKVWHAKGDFPQSLALLDKASEIFISHWEEEPHPRRLAAIYLLQAKCFHALGNHEAANQADTRYLEYAARLDPVARNVVEKGIT